MRFNTRAFANLCAIVALGSLCLAPGFVIADALNAKTSSAFPRIGKVTKVFQTDATCAFTHRNQLIFVDLYPENEFWMNLNGKDVKLVPLLAKNGIYKFQFAKTLILIKYGSAIEEVPPPGKIGMDGIIFKKAKITLINESKKATLNIKGGCDGGAEYGR
jgi:hypothetical protein